VTLAAAKSQIRGDEKPPVDTKLLPKIKLIVARKRIQSLFRVVNRNFSGSRARADRVVFCEIGSRALLELREATERDRLLAT
jgi:hypothetical protein